MYCIMCKKFCIVSANKSYNDSQKKKKLYNKIYGSYEYCKIVCIVLYMDICFKMSFFWGKICTFI